MTKLTHHHMYMRVGTWDGVLDSPTPAPTPEPVPSATPNPVPAAAIATGGGGTPPLTPAPTHPLLLPIPLLQLLQLLLFLLVVVVLPHLCLHPFATPLSGVAPTHSGAFAVTCLLVPANLGAIAPLHSIGPCTWFVHTGPVHGCLSSLVLDFGCLHSFTCCYHNQYFTH